VVQVTAIAPGAIGLPRGFSEKGQEAIRKRTPMGRFGEPEEVAETVVFLATCSDFITGQVLFVDGGLSLR
ncbi:MAG: SDR family oxidoreductase, partial [Candidatus Methylomirabilales bacterium]